MFLVSERRGWCESAFLVQWSPSLRCTNSVRSSQMVFGASCGLCWSRKISRSGVGCLCCLGVLGLSCREVGSSFLLKLLRYFVRSILVKDKGKENLSKQQISLVSSRNNSKRWIQVVGFEKERACNRVFSSARSRSSCCARPLLSVGSQPASVSFPSEVAVPATLKPDLTSCAVSYDLDCTPPGLTEALRSALLHAFSQHSLLVSTS